ncbi:LOW QUALITY PROTEIN: rhomboid-related protein 4-like [Meriones unguiculatus]|uniref:LOW QUALITY PROTEIN: rhomboid-related protein 4-like n=1 Tax=Meriones unguiculatus TaxID=10047 RepID=UPI00293F2FEF|nr:LOW QUALITY PROTEIN: rhomboid-related protein 4-like [Meriones unguiculatus]
MQRRSRGVNAGLLMRLSQVFHVGINNIPPVTLATLAVNVWFSLNPLKSLYHSCLSVEKCYHQKDWQRLLLSPLHRADDWHLYFNMVSVLWKGIKLEGRLGSRWFAYVISTLSLLTRVVYLLLQFAVAEFTNQPGLRRNCAVCFSGVLFALKVLNNHYCPGAFVNILGFPVPKQFACWAELMAIHFCTPGTSFAGRLAGILVGLMYTRGPLKKIMEACAGIFFSSVVYPRQQCHFNGAGPSGYQNHSRDGRAGACGETHRSCDVYTAGLSKEEQLERALRDSLMDQKNARHGPAPYGFRLTPEEEMRRQSLPRSDGQRCGAMPGKPRSSCVIIAHSVYSPSP